MSQLLTTFLENARFAEKNFGKASRIHLMRSASGSPLNFSRSDRKKIWTWPRSITTGSIFVFFLLGRAPRFGLRFFDQRPVGVHEEVVVVVVIVWWPGLAWIIAIRADLHLAGRCFVLVRKRPQPLLKWCQSFERFFPEWTRSSSSALVEIEMCLMQGEPNVYLLHKNYIWACWSNTGMAIWSLMRWTCQMDKKYFGKIGGSSQDSPR